MDVPLKPETPPRAGSHLRPLSILSAVALLPAFVLLVRGRDLEFASAALLQSLLGWIALVCALSRWRLLLWISLPIVLLVPIEAKFIALYGYPSSRHAIALVSETTAAEATEFLSGLWPALLSGLAVVSLIWIWLFRRWPDRRLASRPTQVAAIALMVAASLGPELARVLPGTPLSIRQFTWANSFPLGVPYRVAGYLRATVQVADARAAIERFEWHATSTASDMDLVFVIGESSRPDHWGLAGYARDTTPRLSAMADVVFLADLVTPWTLTRYSVPTLLTRKPATLAGVLPEKSLIAAFREAGFETHWFANQDGMDEVSLHVREAEFVRSYNLAVGRGDIDAEFDGAMLPAIREALQRPARRKLIVVHTKGSHWDYDRRYPPAFAHFKPDHVGNGESGKYDPANRDVLVNAYDNSIRYTDYFLAEIIAALRSTGRPSALVYVSDHGQGLYDNGCTLFGQGNDLEASFRTAGLIWLSPSMLQTHPSVDQTLRRNASRPILTAQTVINTIADIGALSISDAKHSLISNSYLPQTRWVNTTAGGAVDFDQKGRVGSCRLVVDPARN